LAVVTNLKR